MELIAGAVAIPLTYDSPSTPFPDLFANALARFGLLSLLPAYPALQQLVIPLLPSNVASAVRKNLPSAGVLGGLASLSLGLQDSHHLPNLLSDSNWGVATLKASGLRGDVAWTANVSFGTPPQSLRINIDSGSADLFAFSPTCTSCNLTERVPFYPARSSTFHNLSAPFSITYADMTSVEGYTVLDSITLGQQGSGVVGTNQTFALATDVTGSFSRRPIDGLMGIGMDSLSVIKGGRSVFSRLVTRNQLKRPVVGVALLKEDKTANEPGGGEYMFGDVNGRWVAGGETALEWVTVTSTNFWGVPLTRVMMNGKNLMANGDAPRAMIDTGASLILTSEAIAARIHANIPNAMLDQETGVWRLPCFTGASPVPLSPIPLPPFTIPTLDVVKLPDVHRTPRHQRRGAKNATAPNLFFVLGNSALGVPIGDLAYQQIQDSQAPDGGTMCYSGVQGGSEDFTILGDLFIKNHYIVFDYGNMNLTARRMGFGNRTDIAPIL